MNNLIAWIVTAIVYGTVIMAGALGENINEKSGHLNLGVPGIMYAGGFISYYACYCYETSSGNPDAFSVILIALLTSLFVGAVFGLLYSLMCVTFKCNQNVTGLLIASFGVGFGKFLSILSGVSDAKASFTGTVFNASVPGLSAIPFFGEILFGHGFMVYLVVILAILAQFFMSRTRIGLNLKAVGESPATADAMGIRVNRYKYISTVVGCALCGMAGMIYVLVFGNGLWSTNNNIEAIGWLSVALVIFATWKPKHLIWGSYLFGLLFWAYNYLPSLIPMPRMKGFSELLKMLPYLVTILILIRNSMKKRKENQPPSSLGVSYFREDR